MDLLLAAFKLQFQANPEFLDIDDDKIVAFFATLANTFRKNTSDLSEKIKKGEFNLARSQGLLNRM